MNPNTPRPGHLFFTPRTPWGTRAWQQSFRQHQRASEDKKPDPTSKQMQGLGGQMAPNNAKGWSGPARDDQGAKVWSAPHLDDRGYPQPPPRQGQGRQPSAPAWGTMISPRNPKTTGTAKAMADLKDHWRPSWPKRKSLA